MPPAVSSLLWELGASLLNAVEEKNGASINSLTLWRNISKPLQNALDLDAATQEKFPFVKELASAVKRLEDHIKSEFSKFSKDVVMKHGVANIKGALSFLNDRLDFSLPTPLYVTKVVHTLRNGESFSHDEKDAILPDTKSVQKHLPNFVKVHGIDLDFMAEILPEKTEEVRKFQESFESNVVKWLQQCEASLTKNVKAFAKYRQGSMLLVWLKGLFLFCSLENWQLSIPMGILEFLFSSFRTR